MFYQIRKIQVLMVQLILQLIVTKILTIWKLLGNQQTFQTTVQQVDWPQPFQIKTKLLLML